MSTASILSVCRVHQLLPDDGTVGVTAIDKRPSDGPLKVRRLGLRGDVQADRANHGGEDKALYAYSESDARWWAEQLGEEVPPGRFGENLRVDGIEASEAVIGERWQLGARVVVEVTMPRVPCATFARRLGQERWVRRFTDAGRPGAYLRVIETGEVSAGDYLHVLSRPQHGVTVGRWLAEPTVERAQALLDADVEGEIRLAAEVRPYVERALAREV